MHMHTVKLTVKHIITWLVCFASSPLELLYVVVVRAWARWDFQGTCSLGRMIQWSFFILRRMHAWFMSLVITCTCVRMHAWTCMLHHFDADNFKWRIYNQCIGWKLLFRAKGQKAHLAELQMISCVRHPGAVQLPRLLRCPERLWHVYRSSVIKPSNHMHISITIIT